MNTFKNYGCPKGCLLYTSHFAGVQDLAEQYGGNYETEWEFLRTVLQKNGVPEKAILREDQAT